MPGRSPTTSSATEAAVIRDGARKQVTLPTHASSRLEEPCQERLRKDPSTRSNLRRLAVTAAGPRASLRLRRRRIQDCDSRDLHELRRQRQVCDADEVAGGPVRSEVLRMQPADVFEVLAQTLDEHRRLNDLLSAGAEVLQDAVQVGQSRPGLQLEVTLTNEVGLVVVRQLTGDVDRGTSPHRLRVAVHRLPRDTEGQGCRGLRGLSHDYLFASGRAGLTALRCPRAMTPNVLRPRRGQTGP